MQNSGLGARIKSYGVSKFCAQNPRRKRAVALAIMTRKHCNEKEEQYGHVQEKGKSLQ